VLSHKATDRSPLRSNAGRTQPRAERQIFSLLIWFARTALAIAVLSSAQAAHAHRLDLFVAADGAVIEGKATYAPGGPAQRGTVRFSDPDGGELGVVELQSDGSFSFQTPVRCDIEVTVDTPDGHGARKTLPASALPAALPAWNPDGAGAAAPVDAAAPGPQHVIGVATATSEDLEQAIARQVTPLRGEIAALERSIRMRDILGGFGYIAGIAGLLLCLKTRRSGAP